ncbi:SDR family NAD(P)-dependent oxidoreductase, partial [Pseudomonas aeruginosa]
MQGVLAATAEVDIQLQVAAAGTVEDHRVIEAVVAQAAHALEDHARLLAINLQGVLNCGHAAFPFLRARPQAQVLNMGSAAGLYGVPERAVSS